MKKGRFYIMSAMQTFVFFFAVIIIIAAIFFGLIRGISEEADLDRRLESESINALQDDPESGYGKSMVTQGKIKAIEQTHDLINDTIWLIIGGNRPGDSPIRVLVYAPYLWIQNGTVVRVEGVGMPDPVEPGHLAMEAETVQEVPVARFELDEIVMSTIAIGGCVGLFLAAVGGYWEWINTPVPHPSGKESRFGED